MYYIQEIDKPDFISKIFNIVKIENNKILLPIDDEEISNNKSYKLAKKIKQILINTNCKKIVLSNKIKKYKELINYLYTYQYEIMDGKWLFEVMSKECIDYISEKQGLKKEETTVSILINDLTENTLENINNIIQEYKRVNIITNHIEKFKKIEKTVLDKYGIMITVGNNKKKSLSKAKIILNVDFPTELINQYNIYENAIILNLKGNVKINKKRYNGININDYEISVKNLGDMECFRSDKYKMAEIYEAQIYKKQPYRDIIKKLKKDKVEISDLKGENSNI